MRRIVGSIVYVIVICALTLSAQDQSLVQVARSGRADRLKAILDKGGSADTREGEGVTALMVAAARGDVDMAKQLLGKGADVNHQDSSTYKLSPLMVAALGDHPDMVTLLLGAGARPGAEGFNGTTSFDYAKKDSAVQKLLEQAFIASKTRLTTDVTKIYFILAGMPKSGCFEHVYCSKTPPDR